MEKEDMSLKLFTGGTYNSFNKGGFRRNDPTVRPIKASQFYPKAQACSVRLLEIGIRCVCNT